MSPWVELTKGLRARVDRSDYEELNKYKWTATNCNGRMYAHRHPRINGKRVHIYMHRQIMGLTTGNGHGIEVDHLNGDGLDNRQANLRPVNHAENMTNQRRWSKARYRGVVRSPGRKRRWTARIVIKGHAKHLGSYRRAKDAAEAYDRAALIHHGPFAKLNFPEIKEDHLNREVPASTESI